MWTWHKTCAFPVRWRALAGAGILWVLPAWAADDLGRLPDPTRPPTAAEAPAPTEAKTAPTGPELQSTLVSTAFRRAVISGRSYKLGDRVDGAVLTDIQPYEVTLKRGERETRLRLLPKLVKEQKTLPDRTPGDDG